MDIFKLKPGGYERIYAITPDIYFSAAGRKPPYVVPSKSAKGKNSHYAVCPECDNPIQIVGLFRDTPESGKKPYGRHHRSDLPCLAKYNEDDYYNCSFSNPGRKKAVGRRSTKSRIGRTALKLIREQYDRMIYILQKDMEIYISAALAEQMLERWDLN